MASAAAWPSGSGLTRAAGGVGSGIGAAGVADHVDREERPYPATCIAGPLAFDQALDSYRCPGWSRGSVSSAVAEGGQAAVASRRAPALLLCLRTITVSATGGGVGEHLSWLKKILWHPLVPLSAPRSTSPRILQTMRTVGGQALSPTDWKALLDTEANEQGCSVAQPTPPQGWYHTCYVWSIIAMASYVVARDSARLAQKTLFYVQAVDVITNYSASCPQQSRDLFRSLLQVPSLTKTKRLPAFCLLHVGMEVRLTTTLDQPYAVQDATATVLEIREAEHDAAAQQYMRSAAQPEEVLLDQLPVAVLVRLHDCKHVFLPCEPCDGCEAFNSLCEKCGDKRKDLEGIFAVQPIPRSWTYDGPELKGQYVNVARRQLPLAPARVLPLYSMQGMTAEPGLVAHWTFPPRLDYDIKWLICYVILSRVPSLPQLMSIGLSDKIRAIIEGGPPDSFVQAFNTLFQDKAEQTMAAALEARHRLGW